MATIIIAALVIVPIALFVGDLVRGRNGDDVQHRSYGSQLDRG
jgi:hypothetical protein